MNWVEAIKGKAEAPARSSTPRVSSRSCCSASSHCAPAARSTTTARKAGSQHGESRQQDRRSE
jgi:hypothetical protein